MNKINKEELEVVSEVSEQESRRNFFKKTATYSMGALAAASVVAPVTIDASEQLKRTLRMIHILWNINHGRLNGVMM